MRARREVFPTALVSLLTLALAAHAVVLPPGGSVATPGSPGGGAAGVVIHDSLIPFEISGPGGVPLLFRGNLQNRVVRRADGNLSFIYQIRDTQAGLNGVVDRIESFDFGLPFSADVDWSTTSTGTVPISRARRGAPSGEIISYIFGAAGPPMVGGNSSRFIVDNTDARFFGLGGRTTIVLTTGDSVTIPTVQPRIDTTPPDAIIASPGPFECVCNPATITGTANDPEGLRSWTLAFAANPAGPYSTIAASSVPVVGGVLGVWDTTGLATGFYFLRLEVENAVGTQVPTGTVVFVVNSVPIVAPRSPVAGGIYGGTVCFDGTVDDHCFRDYFVEFRAFPAGVFAPISPGQPFTTPVINDPLGSWNTASVADGPYEVRIRASNVCGLTSTVTRRIVVDNTAPVALIRSHRNCDTVRPGLVAISGTASDANLCDWSLQYTGGDTNTWVTIASGNTSVVNGVLGVWDTRNLAPCSYTLRLRVADCATVNCSGNTVLNEYYVSIDLGCPMDFNGDGDLNADDLSDFITAYFTGC